MLIPRDTTRSTVKFEKRLKEGVHRSSSWINFSRRVDTLNANRSCCRLYTDTDLWNRERISLYERKQYWCVCVSQRVCRANRVLIIRTHVLERANIILCVFKEIALALNYICVHPLHRLFRHLWKSCLYKLTRKIRAKSFLSAEIHRIFDFWAHILAFWLVEDYEKPEVYV